MHDVTRILKEIDSADSPAAEQLLSLIYDDLRRLAAEKLAHEKAGQTLQATALVHEAWLRLVDVPSEQRWESRGHFYKAASEAMRRILIENARRRASQKRGGNAARVDLDTVSVVSAEPSEDLLALDEALTELGHHDAQSAELVKLRYFGGVPHQEAAEMLGISRRAADRLWVIARAWLYQRLKEKE